MKFNSYFQTISACLCCVLLPFASIAQVELKGHIKQSNNEQPLPGVTVFIPDLQRGTVTDENGNYSITNLPSSTIQVQFTSVGFKSQMQTINLKVNSVLNIEMEITAMEMEEVLITSNNSKLPDNIPFSANSISRNEIGNYSSPSVMGNLSYLPGIDKITIGNGIGKPVIRGLSFNRIMLYSQGTRIENQQWDDHHDLGLSDVGIENVEIVRGPAALIYGADALGGALIFRDEKPAAAGTNSGDASLGFASNTLGLKGDVGMKSSKNNGFFYGFRIGLNSQTSYVQGERDGKSIPSGEAEEFAFNSKFLSGIGKLNAGLSKSWGVSKFTYSYFNQQIGIVEDESADSANIAEEEGEQREREIEAPNQSVVTQIFSLENTFVTGKSKVNLNLAYQLNNRKEFEPLPLKKKELAIGLNLKVATYDVKWSSDVEKQFGITLGSQGTFLKNENNGLESLVPDATVSDVAGYALIRYDFKKLNLLGGLRYDLRKIEAESYEISETQDGMFAILHQGIVSGDTIQRPKTDFVTTQKPVSFSLGASYHINKELTLKINGATGFTAPNYAQLGTFGKHEGTYRFERGNQSLKMEHNVEGDLGLIWENEFITINATGFINHVKDYIYLINTGDSMVRIKINSADTLPLYDYQQDDATLTGFEAGFDIHPKNLNWLDVSLSYSMVRGKLDIGEYLPFIPSGKFVGIVKLMKEKMGIVSDAYFTIIFSNFEKQDKITEYEISSPGYYLVDLHFGGSLKLGKKKIDADLFCTNLLNKGYYNQLSLIKYIGVLEMGRSIGINLKMPIFTNR